MASNLACVGLAVADVGELRSLIGRIVPQAAEIGRVGDLRILRWQDPSGARLVLGVTPNDVPDLLPSFAGTRRTRLQGIRMVNDEVALAAVVDENGEQLTSLAVEIEERRLLPRGEASDQEASLVGLAVDVSIFATPEAFEQSDASLLSPEQSESEPPAHYVEHGWKWPPRVASSSFISHGVFGEPATATAHARLSGIVSSTERRIVRETGQAFIAAVVSTIGFEVTVCLADRPDLPVPGGVISGTVFMTAALDGFAAPKTARKR